MIYTARFWTIAAGCLLTLAAVFLATAACSNDWVGYGKAVPPSEKLPLDESAGTLIELNIASQSGREQTPIGRSGMKLPLEAKLALDAPRWQWPTRTFRIFGQSPKSLPQQNQSTLNATRTSPPARQKPNLPRPLLMIEISCLPSFGSKEILLVQDTTSLNWINEKMADCSCVIQVPQRLGTYRMRIFLCNLRVNSIRQIPEKKRLLLETDFEVVR